jgi:hypothetical protein
MAKTRTTIQDIPEFGPELDEGELLVVTGGAAPMGDPTGGPCGACH